MNEYKNKFIENTLSVQEIFIRNRFLLGDRVQQDKLISNHLTSTTQELPKYKMLDGKMAAFDDQHETDNILKSFVWSDINDIELVCMYFLDVIHLKTKISEKSLRDILRDLEQKSESTQKVYRFLKDTLENTPEVFNEMTGIVFRYNKTHRGMSGNVLYTDKRYSDKTISILFNDCLNRIFGEDTLGKAVTRLLNGSECPNILDVVSREKFSTLIAALQSEKNKPTNMQNYFACRGYVYLNQSLFCSKGYALGAANKSLVLESLAVTANPVTAKRVSEEIHKNEDRDMVLLYCKSVKKQGQEVAYFATDELIRALSDANCEISSIKPAALSSYFAINLQFDCSED